MNLLCIDRESVRARAVQEFPKRSLSQQKLVEAAGAGGSDQIHIWLGATPSNPALARYIAESKAVTHVVRRADKGAVEVDMTATILELEGLESVTFVSGSGALAPLVRRLLDVGVAVKVVAFSDVLSGDLLNLGVEVEYLDTVDIYVDQKGGAERPSTSPAT